MITTTARMMRWWATLPMAGLLVAAACGNDTDDRAGEASDTDAVRRASRRLLDGVAIRGGTDAAFAYAQPPVASSNTSETGRKTVPAA
jgi:hypothetical protein